MNGCNCADCTRLREWNERADTYEKAKAERPPSGWPKMEPEPASEPVYTHVLVDYGDDGTPLEWAAELHTAESLIEALADRYNDGERQRYQVYKLGQCILNVGE